MSQTAEAAQTPESEAQEMGTPGIGITGNAAKRIATLIEQENDNSLRLRITVSGGGCSGFRYDFDFDNKVNEDDRLFSRDGVGVVIDEVSLELLGGSELDFVEDLIGSYFEIKNPNASSSCGCGASFAI